MKVTTKCKTSFLESRLKPGLHTLICLFISCGLMRLGAQSLTFSTLAGHGGPGMADGVGNAAGFNNPLGAAVDSSGNIYVADTGNHTIRKITPAGACNTLAGLAGVAGSADGTNSGALFNRPSGIAVDNAGTVYVADTGNHTIRKITPAGVVTTLAGTPGTNGTGAGQFNFPQGLAVDSLGNIYVADTWNHAIKMVTSGGGVSAFAGQAGLSGTNDATGTSARFNQPRGVAVDGAGKIYVADSGNHIIRTITPGGAVSTLAGLPLSPGSSDGLGSIARFYQPTGIGVDAGGNIYVADFWNQTIRRVTSGGLVATIAGSATNSGSADGINGSAHFWGPAGMAVRSNSVLYVADSSNGTIRKMAASGVNWIVSTLAGYASAGTADGTQAAAQFYWPAALAVDGQGNTFVADARNHVIRKVTAAGAVSTFAGLVGVAGSMDGTGVGARFNQPQGIDVDASGLLYVADTGNHTIRTITAGGVVTTLAGSAGNVGPLDGSGTSALFNNPQAIAVDDSSGFIYVADTWSHTIRKVTSGGSVSTLAGQAGFAGGSDGTNGKARFYYPAGITASGGNIYVADGFNHTVRKITAAGVVTTIAGMPGAWGTADGTNSDARFFQPQGIAVDGAGTIFVMDAGNQTVRRISASGTNWTVTTVAGLPGFGGSGNGTGGVARFNYSAGLALDASGNVYIADAGNNAIRVSRLVAPQLQIASAGNQASVFWSASGFGFVPETTALLQGGWTAVTSNVVTSGDISVLNFTAGSGSGLGLYRLHKP
jgi:sugar lactone lactonase YvrE